MASGHRWDVVHPAAVICTDKSSFCIRGYQSRRDYIHKDQTEEHFCVFNVDLVLCD